jgi:hypothetical protein
MEEIAYSTLRKSWYAEVKDMAALQKVLNQLVRGEVIPYGVKIQ